MCQESKGVELIGTVTTVAATVEPLHDVGGDRDVRWTGWIDAGALRSSSGNSCGTVLSVRVAGAVLCRDSEGLLVRAGSCDYRPTARSGEQDLVGGPVAAVCCQTKTGEDGGGVNSKLLDAVALLPGADGVTACAHERFAENELGMTGY